MQGWSVGRHDQPDPGRSFAALSLSLDMKAVTDYFEKTLCPLLRRRVRKIDLDQVIPQLGIKPRDALEAFTGEDRLALTEVSMEGGGPTQRRSVNRS